LDAERAARIAAEQALEAERTSAQAMQTEIARLQALLAKGNPP
jgi:hypothetical protein